MLRASLGFRKLSWLAILVLPYPANASKDVSKKVSEPSALEVKLETSRMQITPGLGMGVTAEIKNVSDSTVYIYEKTTTLTLPPEMEQTGQVTGWYADFPTVTHKEAVVMPDGTKVATTDDVYYDNTFALKPKDSYDVFWTSTNKTNNTNPRFVELLLSQLRFIFFPPGDYKLSVSVQYWADVSRPGNDYRTITQSATVHVAAPEVVVFLGAAFGGLIAYFILPQARKKLMQDSPKFDANQRFTYRVGLVVSRLSQELVGFLGAILLSVIITILLARLSETEFLVRVTVNDFWGAVAVGFVANYAGAKAIEKILNKFDKQQQPNQQPSP